MAERATYVQRERVRGWRAPAEGVLCTRTRASWMPWGNPFRIGDQVDGTSTVVRDAGHAVALYRQMLRSRPDIVDAAVRQLTGRTLLCWCRPDAPFQVQDVLMPLVNEGRLP